MANSASARKRARQSAKRRRQTMSQRSMVRTYIKRVESAIAQGDSEKAAEEYRRAVPIIDRMAGKGRIHKNKAARNKSRLAAHIRRLAS